METVLKQKKQMIYLPLIVLMFTQIGTSGDNAVLSVATNALISALHASMNDIQLANMVYSLCAGAFMVAGGMLGIIIGWKKNFRIGVILAIIGELMLAISTNVVMFTWGGRLLVGLGASFMIPSVLGLIPGIYSGKERVFAFGAIGAATGIAAGAGAPLGRRQAEGPTVAAPGIAPAAGPIVAGFLLDAFGFRVAFGALAVYFFLILIGSTAIPEVERSTKKLKMDVRGTIVAAIGLFLFLIGISKISVWGLITPLQAPFTLFGISPSLPLALLGVIILALLVVMEKSIEQKNGCALLPSSFLKSAQVRAGLFASAIVFLYLGGTVMLVNPYLQVVGGFNAVQTGVAMICVGAPMFAASMGVPKYAAQVHPKTILRIGYILLAVSVIPMAFSLQEHGVSIGMYIGLIIAGIGQGMLSAQASNVVALAVNERDAQQSGGIQATARNVGQAIGVAVLGMVMIFTINANLGSSMEKDALLSASLVQQEEAKNVSFMSDEAFISSLSDLTMKPQEQQELVRLNAQARMHSTQYALYVLGILSLVCIFSTGGITVTKKNRHKFMHQ